jgi:DNA-binding NtrC family response regulator
VLLSLDMMTAQYIRKALEQCNGLIEGEKGVARLLHIHPSTLRKRMKKLGIAYGRRARKQEVGKEGTPLTY